MSTDLARRQQKPETGLSRIVEDAKDRLIAALPAHLTPERTAQLLSVIGYRTPDLAKCTPESIVTSLIQAGNLDLDFSPGLNEAHLVPRWNGKAKCLECTFMPGYKGLEKLAVRTGAVRYIQPREVYEHDEFSVWHEDDRTHIHHKPAFGRDRGRAVYVYAIAKMEDGSPLIEVMTVDEVEDIHRRTDNYRKAMAEGKEERSPWVTDWFGMARKTVIRKHCKSLPRVARDPETARAFAQLDAAIEADNAQYTDWRESQGQLPKPQNNSGYGHGMYASPEQSREFETAMKGFLAKTNDRWLTSLDVVCKGEIPDKIRELNEYQADAHLLKWAVETGRLDAKIVPEDAKIRQRYRYTAIVYHRSTADRKALGKELESYAEIHWRRQLELLAKLRPELADAIRERYGEPAAEDEADPEFDESEMPDREPNTDG